LSRQPRRSATKRPRDRAQAEAAAQIAGHYLGLSFDDDVLRVFPREIRNTVSELAASSKPLPPGWWGSEVMGGSATKTEITFDLLDHQGLSELTEAGENPGNWSVGIRSNYGLAQVQLVLDAIKSLFYPVHSLVSDSDVAVQTGYLGFQGGDPWLDGVYIVRYLFHSAADMSQVFQNRVLHIIDHSWPLRLGFFYVYVKPPAPGTHYPAGVPWSNWLELDQRRWSARRDPANP
jgi:hypothetical protein